MSALERLRLGRLGEEAVARRYEKMGFFLVAQNVRVSHNEIDLILQSPTHVAFVEVKTRHAIPGVRTKYGRPAQAVNASKRGHMVEAAKAYLREHPTELQPRIDVAEVYVKRLPDGSDEILAIQIYPNEFRGR